MLRRRIYRLFFMLVAAIGVASSAGWIAHSHALSFLRPRAGGAVLGLMILLAATAGSIAIRWLRWQYLCRQFGFRIPTRDSARIYIATLPAIATPFYVGEIVRGLLIRDRPRRFLAAATGIWFIERSADALILLAFLLAATMGPPAAWAGLGVLVLVVLLLVLAKGRRGRGWAICRASGLLVVSTAMAWGLVLPAMSWSARLLGQPVDLAASTRVFSSGTLVGGVTGIPMGVAITGGQMIHHLRSLGLAEDAAVSLVALQRAGTSWFAFSLGLVCLVVYRRRLLLNLGQSVTHHFDEISDDYEEDIPAHVRDRLLVRKIDTMVAKLPPGEAAALAGLDIGCGQGWYACELARRGYRMHACDASSGQIEYARANAAKANVELTLCCATASALPYADNTFDFAYSINVFHHITDLAAREIAFREVVRVLKPGGVFFLQEINTTNPVFLLYAEYLFPLIHEIDDGTERFIRPAHLPSLDGAAWQKDVEYFTFLPDFVPARVLRLMAPLERALEKSFLRSWSAHYVARLIKDGPSTPAAAG